MPIKEESQRLGYSKANALKRFLRLEQNLHRDESVLKKYSAFIQELLDLGHLEEVESLELDVFPNYYLPQNWVLKEDSWRTKLRVVLTQARKQPQASLCKNVYLSVRTFRRTSLIFCSGFDSSSCHVSRHCEDVSASGTLQKEKDYHRIFWSFDRKQPFDTFRMTRVTYGVASSSYHYIRSLVECANLKRVSPEAQILMKRDFYVDDILTGANSVEEAKKLQSDLFQALKQAKFDLRKWTCSEASLVLSLPPKCREANDNSEFLENNHTIKTLWIVWNPTQDVFLFNVAHVEGDTFDKNNVIKRQMLSDISKILVPFAWLSPVTIQLKQMMQKTWEASANWAIWDDKLLDHLVTTYFGWRSKLISLI